MLNLTEKLLTLVFTMLFLAAPRAEALCISKRTMTMKDVPTAERDDVRNAKVAISEGGGGLTVFNNAQKCLPAVTAKGDDQYYEFYPGHDRSGGAGKHRLVIQAGTKNGKRGIIAMWYTDDHYETFTEITG